MKFNIRVLIRSLACTCCSKDARYEAHSDTEPGWTSAEEGVSETKDGRTHARSTSQESASVHVGDEDDDERSERS